MEQIERGWNSKANNNVGRISLTRCFRFLPLLSSFLEESTFNTRTASRGYKAGGREVKNQYMSTKRIIPVKITTRNIIETSSSYYHHCCFLLPNCMHVNIDQRIWCHCDIHSQRFPHCFSLDFLAQNILEVRRKIHIKFFYLPNAAVSKKAWWMFWNSEQAECLVVYVQLIITNRQEGRNRRRLWFKVLVWANRRDLSIKTNF